MTNAIPPIMVQIAADVSQLKAGLAQAEASIRGMNGTVATANTGMQSMIVSAKRMAGAMGVAFAGTQIMQFGKDVIMSASSMNESISKINVVFGQGASEVLKFGESAAKSMGLSNQQAIEAAGTYGNLFQAFGIGQAQAQTMSTSLVQLASDLASFNNTSVDDALVALRSGLSGETEPLKRFGVALNETTLKAKAFEMGFGKIKGAMDPAIKAQVTYALVMEQTKLAQGDYARTASGTANTMKTLSAQFADAKVAIGDLVLPAFNALLAVTGLIIPVIQSLADFIKENSDGLRMLAIVLGIATAGFYAFKAAMIAARTVSAAYTAILAAQAAGFTLAQIAAFNFKVAIMLLNAAMRANPVGALITALMVLGAAFVWAWKKSETFRGIVIKGVQIIVTGFSKLLNAIAAVAGALGKLPGMGKFKGISEGIKKAADETLAFSKNLSDLKKTKAGFGEGAFNYQYGLGADGKPLASGKTKTNTTPTPTGTTKNGGGSSTQVQYITVYASNTNDIAKKLAKAAKNGVPVGGGK